MTDTSIAARPTHTRHIVLALIVGAYMITYMDRVNIASAVPVIQKDLGFSMVTIGWIFASFRWGYAFFQIPGGWLGDRIGGRRALSLVVVWWSIFTSLTAFSWNALSMGLCRFFFGMGEAGAFPIATRSLSRWMLPTERGFAQGLTHAASRVGAALTPALVVMMMLRFGWRAPFFFFGLIGLVWSAVWYWYYRDTPGEHSRISAAERRLIEESIGIPLCPHPLGAVAAYPWQPFIVDTLADVFLLRICDRCVSGLVSKIFKRTPRLQSDPDGLLCQPAPAGGSRRRSSGWNIVGSLRQEIWKSKNGAPRCRVGGISARSHFYCACDFNHAFDCFGFVFLRCGLWPGSHSGCIVGNSAGYWWRLRGFDCVRHEYFRQSR